MIGWISPLCDSNANEDMLNINHDIKYQYLESALFLNIKYPHIETGNEQEKKTNQPKGP